jgi:hypothetical protein
MQCWGSREDNVNQSSPKLQSAPLVWAHFPEFGQLMDRAAETLVSDSRAQAEHVGFFNLEPLSRGADHGPSLVPRIQSLARRDQVAHEGNGQPEWQRTVGCGSFECSENPSSPNTELFQAHLSCMGDVVCTLQTLLKQQPDGVLQMC